MRPRLKGVWERNGDELRLVYDIRDHFLLSDPDGAVEALLELLREGGRTLPELAAALAGDAPPGRMVALLGCPVSRTAPASGVAKCRDGATIRPNRRVKLRAEWRIGVIRWCRCSAVWRSSPARGVRAS